MALETIRGNVKIWENVVSAKTGENGESVVMYSITIGNKQQDGTYINAKLPVNFSNAMKDVIKEHKSINGYDLKITDAWLSNYKASFVNNKKETIVYGKLLLFVNTATIINAKPETK